jgi:hypothetical protein
MAKKQKTNSKEEESSKEDVITDEKSDEQVEESTPVVAAEDGVVAQPPDESSDDGEDSSSDDEEDEDLIMEGVIVRNPDISDSDDTSSEESDDDDDEEDDDKKPKPSSSNSPSSIIEKNNKRPSATTSNKTQPVKKRNKKSKQPKAEKGGPEIVQVDFTFCDMNEIYFHGLKTLLTASSPVYAAQSSALSDLLIENVSVGTVVSTEEDVDGTIFGFASVLNVTTYQDHACIQALKKLCIDKCPDQHKEELETVLSGKTKRPAGFLLHSRMLNMPLEIVEILHQQFVMDMDWAVEHAEGGEDERKSLDFGAFVRIAPSYRVAQSVVAYKFFDDEIFAQNAEFSFEVEVPKSIGMEETPYCSIVVMTKTGHRAAMKEIGQLVNGST